MPALGVLHLEPGAARVIREHGRSVLAVGVEAVSGEFTRGDVVSCVDESGIELGRGLINYSSEEAEVLRGQPSSEIEAILGYIGDDELIHRDNLVMLA